MQGLYITAALGIVFALLFNLNGIASITSSIFIVIYIFVLLAHWRLCKNYSGNRLIIGLGLLVVLTVFAVLLRYQWQTNRGAFAGTWTVLGGSLLLEWIYFTFTRRRFLLRRLPLFNNGK